MILSSSPVVSGDPSPKIQDRFPINTGGNDERDKFPITDVGNDGEDTFPFFAFARISFTGMTNTGNHSFAVSQTMDFLACGENQRQHPISTFVTMRSIWRVTDE